MDRPPAGLRDPVNKHLHGEVIDTFNAEYVYNYFFDPARVTGQPYTPLRSPTRVDTVVAAEASAASTAVAADPNVHFFDDFSTSPAGKAPLNWRSTLDNTGASSVIAELEGLAGHWVSMAGFKLTPSHIKTPLPRDFTISYELVAARGFTWGARGLTFKLSKAAAAGRPESFVSLRLRPGFDGREGEAVVEAQFPVQGYLSGTKWAAAPGFSNNAQHNRITVTVVKTGERLQIFIGQTKIAEFDKAIPEAALFDGVSFELPGAPNDRMFISTVKITRN